VGGGGGGLKSTGIQEYDQFLTHIERENEVKRPTCCGDHAT
jgi:hypothetical protein